MGDSVSTRRVLVVDDEPLMRDFLKEILVRRGHAVKLAQDGEEALSLLRSETFALVLTDWRMRERDGISLLRAGREISPETQFVLMTAYATVESAVEAMKLGASDYLTKPFSGEQVEQLVGRILLGEGRSRAECSDDLDEPRDKHELIGESPQMKEVRSLIRLAASTEATVLLTGETGTGKELVARAIHRQSRRRRNRFIRVNCAALPEGLFESELFGHERGAFTGAVQLKKGRFELAHGGTLLLDEISEMSPGLQAKLLRVLQEKEFERVGGAETISVDVRIIATSNGNLAEKIREQKFRSDLYYRLSVFPIALPPLRERAGDARLLAEHFLRLHCRRNGLGDKEISPQSQDLMTDYSWPGNVRQLENCLERAAILAPGAVIGPEFLPELVEGPESQSEPGTAVWPQGATSLQEVETAFLLRTLEEVGGNRSLAAHRLGISTRTLRNKLHQMGRMDFLKPTSHQGAEGEVEGGKNVPPDTERVSCSSARRAQVLP